jgi:type I restriction enzyme S subunit
MSTATLEIEKKKMLVPQLRFPEFDEEWDQEKVGELCDSIVPGRNKPTNFEGDIPWITTPDIEHNGIINYSKKGLNISREEAKKVGSKIVPINSIIISCVGELGLSAITGKEIIINQQLHAFIPKERIKYRFLLYQLNLKKKYMDKVATKTAVPYMNKDNCNSIPIDFPTLPEQQKIASFLSAIDEKIQQLSRKKELLEQYKKGVMQQLFSGKLRFKDENGEDYADWEEKKLGEIGKFYAGGDLDKLNYNKVKSNEFIYPIYANGSGEGIYGYATTFQYKSNSVTVSGRGNLGYANVRTQSFNAIVRLIVIEPKEFINAKYLEEIINQTKFAIESTGVPQLTVPQIKTYKIPIPSFKEQQKIANFLSSIDTKIESVNKQITQTQTFKKGLLQGMFV